jgi:hypothetical protein
VPVKNFLTLYLGIVGTHWNMYFTFLVKLAAERFRVCHCGCRILQDKNGFKNF